MIQKKNLIFSISHEIFDLDTYYTSIESFDWESSIRDSSEFRFSTFLLKFSLDWYFWFALGFRFLKEKKSFILEKDERGWRQNVNFHYILCDNFYCISQNIFFLKNGKNNYVVEWKKSVCGKWEKKKNSVESLLSAYKF